MELTIRLLLAACCITLWFSQSEEAAAAAINENAKLVIHLSPSEGRSRPEEISRRAPQFGCDPGERAYNLCGEVGTTYTAYVYIADSDPNLGVTAARFFLRYSEGIQVLEWETAANAEIGIAALDGGGWPSSESGNTLIFINPIAKGVTPGDMDGKSSGLLGYLRLLASSPGYLEIVPDPRGVCNDCDRAGWNAAIRVSNGGGESTITYPDNTCKITFGMKNLERDPCSEAPKVTTEQSVHLPELSVGPGTPNPAGNGTRWTITSSKPRNVQLSIFDVRGRLVRSWEKVSVSAGATSLSWDTKDQNGQNVATGVYYLRVQGNDGYTSVRAATVLREKAR